jgi:hypothetical protein
MITLPLNVLLILKLIGLLIGVVALNLSGMFLLGGVAFNAKKLIVSVILTETAVLFGILHYVHY